MLYAADLSYPLSLPSTFLYPPLGVFQPTFNFVMKGHCGLWTGRSLIYILACHPTISPYSFRLLHIFQPNMSTHSERGRRPSTRSGSQSDSQAGSSQAGSGQTGSGADVFLGKLSMSVSASQSSILPVSAHFGTGVPQSIQDPLLSDRAAVMDLQMSLGPGDEPRTKRSQHRAHPYDRSLRRRERRLPTLSSGQAAESSKDAPRETSLLGNGLTCSPAEEHPDPFDDGETRSCLTVVRLTYIDRITRLSPDSEGDSTAFQPSSSSATRGTVPGSPYGLRNDSDDDTEICEVSISLIEPDKDGLIDPNTELAGAILDQLSICGDKSV
jgi:hypothetical protein